MFRGLRRNNKIIKYKVAVCDTGYKGYKLEKRPTL